MPNAIANTISVNSKRLLSDIAALGAIGRKDNAGIFRSAFDEHEMAAREWFKRRVEAAGLSFSVDGAANMYARLDSSADRASVATGSHLDTVPGGGHLDGALGVLAGLEALRRIKESDIDLAHPLEVIAFTDEEGAYGGMFGSQALSGQLSQAQIDVMQNKHGLPITDAMRSAGFDPGKILSAARPPDSMKYFVELHIEQGPVLEQLQKRIGVVTGIAGQIKWMLEFRGKANHAGTTPMSMRQDALLGMSELAVSIDSILHEAGGANSVATIGYADIAPGASNVISECARFSLDVRDTSVAILDELAARFKQEIDEIATRRSLEYDVNELIRINGIDCDQHIMKITDSVTKKFDAAPHYLPSGAVHDAQMIAKLVPTGMIFIPSIGGVSHSATEQSSDEDIVLGANVLLNTLIDLAAV